MDTPKKRAWVGSVCLMLLAFAIIGCTENQRARSWGGNMTVDLPCDEMLFDLTWKTQDFWYATQPMPEGYEPRTTIFREKKDGMSLMDDGTVTVNESRCSAEAE